MLISFFTANCSSRLLRGLTPLVESYECIHSLPDRLKKVKSVYVGNYCSLMLKMWDNVVNRKKPTNKCCAESMLYCFTRV